MPAVKQASLFFTLGSSDKEYHCQIVERDGGYSVEFQYGRRGGPLQPHHTAWRTSGRIFSTSSWRQLPLSLVKLSPSLAWAT